MKVIVEGGGCCEVELEGKRLRASGASGCMYLRIVCCRYGWLALELEIDRCEGEGAALSFVGQRAAARQSRSRAGPEMAFQTGYLPSLPKHSVPQTRHCERSTRCIVHAQTLWLRHHAPLSRRHNCAPAEGHYPIVHGRENSADQERIGEFDLSSCDGSTTQHCGASEKRSCDDLTSVDIPLDDTVVSTFSVNYWNTELCHLCVPILPRKSNPGLVFGQFFKQPTEPLTLRHSHTTQ